jgi:small subunit ribosomal protein S4
MQLFLKGARCFLAKCPIQKGANPPGMHGARRAKLSDYGEQLREKQKLRFVYGLQEEQFRVFFERALKRRGVTGERLLQVLELRLDTVVRRLGWAPSQRAARQVVVHGHVRVNGRRATIPSMILKPGDVITVADRPKSRELVKNALEMTAQFSKGVEAYPWLSLDKEQLRGEVLHVPSRDEIQPVVNEQKVVELYSK